MSQLENCPEEKEIVPPKILGKSSSDDIEKDESNDSPTEKISNNSEPPPDSDNNGFTPVGGAETMARQRYFRSKIELELCNTSHRRVLVYADAHADQYRQVLEQYETFMAEYESNAGHWKEHYDNMQHALDKSMGIRANMTDEELKEVLSRVGCITIFGCGYNPTRELSKKLMKGLRKGYARLVLVDFSQKALRSAIDFLDQVGIKPGAAYQMDLTLGSVASVDSYFNQLSKSSKAGAGIDETKLRLYLDLINELIDSLMVQLKVNGLVAGAFRGYIMKDEDKPGMAVSTMVAAATFMTIYGKLINLIERNVVDPEIVSELKREATRIHSKFNACVVQMITAQMLNFCKDEGSAVIVTEVDKINLGLGTDPHAHDVENEEIRKLEEQAALVRKAVQDNGKTPELQQHLDTVTINPKISQTGDKVDFEQVVKDTPLFDKKFQVVLGPKRQWLWWDEPMDHGHTVVQLAFRAARIPNQDVLELIKYVDKNTSESADAKKILDKILKAPAQNAEKGGVMNNPGIKWLRSLKLIDFELTPDMIGHLPFACESMYQLLNLVPAEYLSQGWEAALAYLCEKEDWLNDACTERHLKVGYKLLIELIRAINEFEEIKQSNG